MERNPRPVEGIGPRPLVKRAQDSAASFVRGLGLSKQAPKQTILHMSMYKFPHPKTIQCVDNMVSTFQQHFGNIERRLSIGCTPRDGRNNSIKDFCADTKYEGILYVDDDMRWPTWTSETISGELTEGFNALARLQARDKPIIGALCTTRSSPIRCTAARFNFEIGHPTYIVDPALIGPGSDEPFTDKFLLNGFGMMYLRRDAILKMVDKFGTDLFTETPMWKYIPGARKKFEEAAAEHAKGGSIETFIETTDELVRRAGVVSEDYSFCVRAYEAGLKVWIDPSFEVQHLGDYGFSRLDAMEQLELNRQAAEKAAKKGAHNAGGSRG